MFKKSLRFAWLILVVALAVSCGVMEKELGTGSISMSVADATGVAPLLIGPGHSTTVGRYHIVLTMAGQDDIVGDITPPNNSIQFDNVPLGTWDITIAAYSTDVSEVLIAAGTSQVTVELNQTSSVNVPVNWLSGTGSVDVDLNLVDDLGNPAPLIVYNPVIEAEWYDSGTWSSISYTDLGNGSWTYEASGIDVGWYAMATRLYSEGTETDLYWGRLEAVLVLADTTSGQVYDITEDQLDIGEEGGSVIVVVDDLITLLYVEITDAPTAVFAGQEFTLHTDADTEVDRYVWAVNGEILAGETTDTVTLNFPEAGVKNISVLAFDDDANKVASDNKSVSVTGAPEFTYLEFDSFSYSSLTVPSGGKDESVNLRAYDQYGNPWEGLTVYVEPVPASGSHSYTTETGTTSGSGEFFTTWTVYPDQTEIHWMADTQPDFSSPNMVVSDTLTIVPE